MESMLHVANLLYLTSFIMRDILLAHWEDVPVGKWLVDPQLDNGSGRYGKGIGFDSTTSDHGTDGHSTCGTFHTEDFELKLSAVIDQRRGDFKGA